MSYDSRCYDLAEVFLEEIDSDEELRADLAQTIQDAVEDWFASLHAAVKEELRRREAES